MEKISTGKRYSKSFKEQAIQMILEDGMSMASVAQKLGVTVHSLRTWKKRYTTKDIPKTISDMEEELRRLRRENHQLREERSILKKAVGIVSTL